MTAPLVLTSMSANDTDVLVACDDETASSGVATQPRTVHANTLQLVALVTVATILALARAGDAVEKFHVAGLYEPKHGCLRLHCVAAVPLTVTEDVSRRRYCSRGSRRSQPRRPSSSRLAPPNR